MLTPHIEETIRTLAQNRPERSFYLYDPSIMATKIEALKLHLPEGVAIYYAMKANPHAAFLETARKAGVEGVEIASFGEGKKALNAGFAPSQIIFTGPGKSPEELEWSVAVGIRTIHVESLTEAYRLNEIAGLQGKRQDILVRVNANFAIHGAQASFSGDSSKLGIDENAFRTILPEILALPNLNFLGLHVYSASGVLDVADLLKNCELVFALADEIENQYQGVTCPVIDFGGGFGIDYLKSGHDFALAEYAAGLSSLITRFGFSGRRFVLELGRYLTADSGWYCTEILDIKNSLGKKQVICAGGAHHFRRPAALRINHPVSIVAMNRPKVFAGQENVKNENVFIGGPLCNTADRLAAHDVAIAHAEIGDMAVFELAGAYGYSMSHLEFLSHAHPPEIVI